MSQKFQSDEIRDVFAPLLNKERNELISRSIRREYCWGLDTESSSDTWHFDDWQPRLKAYIYLNDVDEDNCPFQYMKGSHTLCCEGRMKKEFDYYYNGQDYYRGDFGHYVSILSETLIRKYNLERIIAKPKQGTLVLADTRGIYRRTVPKGGERYVATAFF